MKQFYSRLAGFPQDYWDGVASGKYGIPGSDQILRDKTDDFEWHTTHGYTTGTSDEIFGEVVR